MDKKEREQFDFMQGELAKHQDAHAREYETINRLRLLLDKIRTDAETKEPFGQLLLDISRVCDMGIEMIDALLPTVEV